MRASAVSVILATSAWLTAGPGRAQPVAPWADAEATLAGLMAPIADRLAACVSGRSRAIGVTLVVERDGTTRAGLPLAYPGHRGPTAEDRCLAGVIGALVVPPLPTALAQLSFGYTIGPAPARDPAWVGWRDPVATVAAVVAADRAALAACSARPRTLRLTVDTRRRRTRIWLPAWPYHATDGSGTTTPPLRRVKACHARRVRTWTLPPLPAALGELQVRLPDR